MKPSILRAGFSLALLACGLALPAQEPDMKQKFAQAQKANAAALRQFTWKSRTTLNLKGETKKVKLDQVSYDATGQQQKTALVDPAQQALDQQQQDSGGRNGRLKQKVIANKKEEFSDLMDSLKALVTSYAHMTPEQTQAFAQGAQFSMGQAPYQGTMLIAGKNAVQAGDALRLWVDKQTMMIRHVEIDTALSGDPVNVVADYQGIPNGPNYQVKATVEYPAKQVEAIVENFDYQSTAPAATIDPDPGWPRQRTTPQGDILVYYQPQVDDWKDFTDLTWRMAFSMTPAGSGKEVVGVVELQGHTDVDNDNKVVLISNLQITRTNFPSLDSTTSAQMDQLLRTFLPPSVSITLHRLVACVKKPGSVTGVSVNNDPPVIVVSYSPAILLAVDGEPSLAEIPATRLKFVVNTTWPLFFDGARSAYYLLIGQQWMTATNLNGPWSPTAALPGDMSKVAADPQWAALNAVIPPPAASGAIPKVFYSSRPAEVILFDGKPAYSPIPGTQLLYSTNTSSYLFLHTGTNQYYYLTGGRWFRAGSLQGPWSFATMDLPGDFANIPSDSPASVILASVPGTEEAKDAVLLAQVPTTLVVDPAAAAANVKVSYGGDPKFAPISGTSLSYATNTQAKVIQVGDVYYLCLQGVWFMSTTPQGPWQTAASVPQEIYTIPPSSPVYNVTYVTQTTTSDGSVQSSYTAGYMGAFVVGATVGAIIANGSGYYYPPYIYYPAYGYPAYYPYAATYGAYGAYGTSAYYNSATGAYGVSQTVSGPYGTATRAAAYNPYTGTAARGATASTPYGSRTVAQAYNPYTGAYAATSQGSSPTAQWGSSVVSKGNQSAYTQHYTTSQGTVGSVQTSSGGKAVGSSTAYGNSAAAKTSSGDMYATHNGNVYKNTGSGWQSYDNGGWNSAQPPSGAGQGASSANQAAAQQRAQGAGSANQAEAQQRAQGAQQSAAAQGGADRSGGGSSEMQGMQQEAQNRQRGAQQSERFQGAQRSGGGRRR